MNVEINNKKSKEELNLIFDLFFVVGRKNPDDASTLYKLKIYFLESLNPRRFRLVRFTINLLYAISNAFQNYHNSPVECLEVRF